MDCFFLNVLDSSCSFVAKAVCTLVAMRAALMDFDVLDDDLAMLAIRCMSLWQARKSYSLPTRQGFDLLMLDDKTHARDLC